MSEIKFIELKCQRCGGELEELNETLTCKYCGKKWQKETLHGFTEMLEACDEAIRNQREADIANLRQLLWTETHKEYISNNEVEKLCREILKFLPQDFYANFFLATCNKNKETLGDFLCNVDAYAHYDDISFIIDYVLNALKPEWAMGISNFIDKIKDIDINLFNKYRTLFEDEYCKIEECIFEPAFPRDVFIAYSSKDIDKVRSLVSVLEEENLTCFVAARNICHGSGSADKYEEIIRTAINNCHVVVFVSSDNSRSIKCDAFKELCYIQETCKNKPRVEYLIKNYSGKAAERFFEEFFTGHEHCLSESDVALRVNMAIMTDGNTSIQNIGKSAQPNEKSTQNAVKSEKKKTNVKDSKKQKGGAKFINAMDLYLKGTKISTAVLVALFVIAMVFAFCMDDAYNVYWALAAIMAEVQLVLCVLYYATAKNKLHLCSGILMFVLLCGSALIFLYKLIFDSVYVNMEVESFLAFGTGTTAVLCSLLLILNFIRSEIKYPKEKTFIISHLIMTAVGLFNVISALVIISHLV